MTTNIYDLLNKYFEGKTTREEEKALQCYFNQGNIAEDLQEIAPIFTFLADESAALATPPRSKRLRVIMPITAALAASLFIGIVLLHRHTQTNRFTENYAWVDGERITNPETVRQYAQESFDKVKTEENILDKQLTFMFE
ncbi:MAG: hypothetical protein VB075_03310 [Petrimonas sp.]|jgi:hypothetical protein|uniref:hypothetical protein n=1 Tax=Petrimonas sp. TaxID=2023866 RepID=UPI000E898985|nr:hypothetical protein [Petrimonas sp.]MEA4996448.1 hypothetical protein [Petrimonas sp.]MEA5043595.1 hypothetical protein [Petrimonas sp.]HBG80839.1 hypothetical protein [Porphyromonadaceae bacterium]HMM16757.1 hypothetical protein [Petrimonas sp.]